MVSLMSVETSGFVSHCVELLVLFLTVLVDLIFFAAWYNLHRWANRFLGGTTEAQKAKKVTQNEQNRQSPDAVTRAE